MPSEKVPVVLTIAGFDPSSGAGITADLKTIAAHDCYGVAAITALTVQNTVGVSRVEAQPADLVRETLIALSVDNSLAAIKIGMLRSEAIVQVVVEFVKSQVGKPIVLDPVFTSSSGTTLLDPAGVDILRTELLGAATVITPNLSEAAELTRVPVKSLDGMRDAAKKLRHMGAKNIVITGGHLPENTDLLFLESGEELRFAGPRVESSCTHGTGCAFSTALACGLAHGHDLKTSVKDAKDFVRQAIQAAYPVGKGTGPLNHLFRMS